MTRSSDLQQFLDAAFVAVNNAATDMRSLESLSRMSSLLEMPGAERKTPGHRQPVCDAYFQAALALETEDKALLDIARCLRAIEPRLQWQPRTSQDGTASENFVSSHANATIIGRGGLEIRDDVWMGVSLLAPHVRYTDHWHPPEETYLVLTDGEFMQEDHWFTPGVGGTFYNPPAIKHAMRSTDTPLLAFWALLPERRLDPA
jgi:hypothetical protein